MLQALTCFVACGSLCHCLGRCLSSSRGLGLQTVRSSTKGRRQKRQHNSVRSRPQAQTSACTVLAVMKSRNSRAKDGLSLCQQIRWPPTSASALAAAAAFAPASALALAAASALAVASARRVGDGGRNAAQDTNSKSTFEAVRMAAGWHKTAPTMQSSSLQLSQHAAKQPHPTRTPHRTCGGFGGCLCLCLGLGGCGCLCLRLGNSSGGGISSRLLLLRLGGLLLRLGGLGHSRGTGLVAAQQEGRGAHASGQHSRINKKTTHCLGQICPCFEARCAGQGVARRHAMHQCPVTVGWDSQAQAVTGHHSPLPWRRPHLQHRLPWRQPQPLTWRLPCCQHWQQPWPLRQLLQQPWRWPQQWPWPQQQPAGDVEGGRGKRKVLVQPT